jgi:flagella basal body P-ring formation protein FlgA
MQPVKSIAILAFANLLLVAPQRAQAWNGNSRLALQTEAQAYSPSLTLADLLPRSAPEAFRARCAQISFGESPQPGETRRLTHQEVLNRLIGAPDLTQELAIPSVILVTRFSRPLTRIELLQAIQTALQQRGAGGLNSIHFSDLELPMPIRVTQDDPGLIVTAIEYDPFRQETCFRMRATKDASLVPFAVYVRGKIKVPLLVARHDLPTGQIVTSDDFQMTPREVTGLLPNNLPTLSEITGLATRQVIREGQVVYGSMFGPATLVRTGRPAELILQGARFRATLIVIPMQPGTMGQEVRARTKDRIYQARVVGRDQLYAAL